jgi:hypothetical protein
MATNGDNEGGEGTPEIKSKYRLAGEEETPTSDAAIDDAQGEDDEDADVIDLDEARETREGGPSILDSKLGQTIRSAFRDYVLQNVVPKDQAKGTVNVNLDPTFLRDHGAKLVSNVFQQVVQAFVPPKVEMAIPVGQKGQEAEEGAEDTSTEPTSEEGKPDVDVSLNFDVLNFVKDFFKPKAEAEEAEAEEPTPDAPATDEGDEGDEKKDD